jgi:hypothetical protein
MPADRFDWAVAITSARESPATLASVIDAAIVALEGRRGIIDVLVNGNPFLSDVTIQFVRSKERAGLPDIRIWEIPVTDKSHAWNEYLYRVWPGARFTLFLDGYVRTIPGSLAHMEASLAASPELLCVSAPPTRSRSAEKWRANLARGGGVVGGMYALPARTIEELRNRAVRLPLGLYRGDSLLSAVFSFNFDPAGQPWNPSLCRMCWDAGFEIDFVPNLRIKDAVSQWRRLLRQARGDFENRAYRQHMAIEGKSPSTLPGTDKALVYGWLRAHPAQALRLVLSNPLRLIALHQIHRQPDWKKINAPANLKFQT